MGKAQPPLCVAGESFCFFCFFVFFVFFALFIDLLTDKVQPLSRWTSRTKLPTRKKHPSKTSVVRRYVHSVFLIHVGGTRYVQSVVLVHVGGTRYVQSVCIVHVGGTRCGTSNTDHSMNTHARITLTVECIRTCIFLFVLYGCIQRRVGSRLTLFSMVLIVRYPLQPKTCWWWTGARKG